MMMKYMVPMQGLSLVLGGSPDSSVVEPSFVLFFCDDHGKEAVVGRRKSNTEKFIIPQIF